MNDTCICTVRWDKHVRKGSLLLLIPMVIVVLSALLIMPFLVNITFFKAKISNKILYWKYKE